MGFLPEVRLLLLLLPVWSAGHACLRLLSPHTHTHTTNSPGYDALLVLEHQPVYTLGRSAKAADVKFPLDGIDDPAASEKRGFDVRACVYVCVVG